MSRDTVRDFLEGLYTLAQSKVTNPTALMCMAFAKDMVLNAAADAAMKYLKTEGFQLSKSS